jgi:hypothetical protein
MSTITAEQEAALRAIQSRIAAWLVALHPTADLYSEDLHREAEEIGLSIVMAAKNAAETALAEREARLDAALRDIRNAMRAGRWSTIGDILHTVGH